MSKSKKIVLGCIFAVLALCGISVALSGTNKTVEHVIVDASTTTAEGAPIVASTTTATSALTTAQRNAARSAKSYLNVSGFSRTGLIRQLEFEGYATNDATIAVDSLEVDWNVQAERSARSYLNVSGFSRTGLINQLVFDGYTPEQAAHGADAVGL